MKTRFFRSGYEKTIRRMLDERGIKYGYESNHIVWKRNVSKARCAKCGTDEVHQLCTYTPDFILANGIWIEAKGYLDGPDRTKLKAIRRQFPKLDLRLVFQRDNVIKSTKEKIRYSEWARRNGFKFAIKDIPEDWLKPGTT